MLLEPFVGQLRGLLEVIGLSADEAIEFSGHSPRRGAATAVCRAGVAPNVTMGRAGVTSSTWIDGYDEVEENRRLEGSVVLEPR